MSLLAAALAMVTSASGPVHRYALVVGSNVGEGVSAAPLRFADDDAIAMHELLQEAGVESVLLANPDEDTRRLHPGIKPDAPPTLDALRGAFAGQRASMEKARANGETIEWLFFFSGHGDVDQGEGFLGLEAGRLTRAVLHDDLISRAAADRTHVLIDACRSGLLVGGKGPGGLRLPMPAAFAADPGWPASVGFVLSASALRNSHEWERFQSGIFSYEVRSALRGAADVDGDGAVSYAELGAFLRTANQSIANPSYRPDFLVLPPQGAEGLALPVLAWSGREPVVADIEVGHAYLERANGERLLDFHAAAGFVTRLFVPNERPLFLRTSDERQEVRIDAEALRLSAREPVAPPISTKGSRDQAMTALFSTAYGSDDVADYAKQWKPPDLAALEVRDTVPRSESVRRVAGWTALVGAAVTAASLLTAWELQSGSAQLDQRSRVDRNRGIVLANGVGVAGGIATAAAVVTWAVLTLWGDCDAAIALAPTPGGFSAGLAATF